MFILRLGVILMIIAVIASGALALLNGVTAPIIAENKAKQQAEARKDVTRGVGAVEFAEVTTEDGLTYYRALDEEGSLVGYTTVALGKGYSSTIETVAGYDTTFHVSGLKITFQQETPGLGTKAEEVKKGDKEPWFLKQFKGKDASELAVTQDRGDIDAITGATITARAIANSVRDAANLVEAAVEEAQAAAPADTTETEAAPLTSAEDVGADGSGEEAGNE